MSDDSFEPVLSTVEINKLRDDNSVQAYIGEYDSIRVMAFARAIERAAVEADRAKRCAVPCPRAMNVMQGQKVRIATLERQRGELVEDAKRLDFLISEKAVVYEGQSSNFWLHWPDLDESQSEEFKSAREAIDAMRETLAAQEGSSHGD